ncbi:MAG: 4Fe-4S dicluster domain-containing protein [Candidatus Tectomicrobia bacterium]|uniref:4Fe-4S dicluster domain-containing protein n=1 Tax=Tectimicrobiota bacterium TaxID=2528274 RepID=A0A932G0R4_UNCTE|nr:4Fe-4S dicluster domain-containing protein [Candidatus Tectomicrobia bacterium]
MQIDPEKCTGCRSCELACSLKKTGEFNPARSRIRPIAFLEETLCIPLACLQCEEPLCAKVCPSRALSRNEETGVVSVRTEACIGCRMCTLACPFGLVGFGPEGKAEKCDLCEGAPECVAFCSAGALQFQADDQGRRARLVSLSQQLKEVYPGMRS